ncbi:GCN5-related N-acetyltransferase [Croceitalea dokdonensis DOKDO 023]|uniref:GCN5-related N-acetyltransferase n=1 Tax=Croceitalea dokdonensis DOKDO 023 TaxID=1300341 RepID=A0A0P7AWP4_9FLAO|nr:GNAT family N-acetyltransferase [Croceitalea dokdonensis]KPM30759.1 GCN5-related N-acetyltransferase [Croceitalea dokdonensis DOKDO 023]
MEKLSTVCIVPVTKDNINSYLRVGIQSYKEHYLHLWENSDPEPFISANLTKESVKKALANDREHLFIVECNHEAVGILAITLDVNRAGLPTNNLLLHKIYLTKVSTNQGIGSTVLKFVEDFARAANRQLVWLFTMQKGKPMTFYQKQGYRILEAAEITLPKVKPSEKAMWVMTKSLVGS